jgi:hypothetical protein
MNDVSEKIGEMRAMAKAAHQRLDKLEVDIKDRLDSIDRGMALILKDIHVAQGSKTAWFWLASAGVALVGSSVSAIVTYYLTTRG